MIGLKIPKRRADEIRRTLIKHSLINLELKIKRSPDYVYIPLNKAPDEKLKDEIGISSLEMVDTEFETQKKGAPSLKEYLKGLIPPEKINEIKKSFDIIGEVVILEIPPDLESEKYKIGDAALNFTKRKVVYCKGGEVEGVIRTRKLEHLAGEDVSETIHTEYGSKLILDVRKVYFSPRLASERERIVQQTINGEVIVDMFAGVGPFSVSIARRRKVKIYAIDINPDAIYYLKKNIELNKVSDKIIPISGDVKEVFKNRNINADRIIMNLPGTAYQFLETAVSHLKEGGTLHYYEFSPDFERPVDRIKKVAYPRKVNIIGKRRVKSRSPGVWHVGIDAVVY